MFHIYLLKNDQETRDDTFVSILTFVYLCLQYVYNSQKISLVVFLTVTYSAKILLKVVGKASLQNLCWKIFY